MSQSPSNSLERALVIMQFIGRTPGGLTNLEISREFKIARSTCSYILSRLEREGYLARDTESGKYRLGLKTVVLGRGALREVGFRAASEPTLYRLAADTGLAANLAVLEGDRVLILDRIEGSAFVKAASEESARRRLPVSTGVPRETESRQQLTREYRQPACELPVRTTAVGRVLAAYMTEGQVRALWDRIESCIKSGKGLTSQLELPKDEFMAELARVHDQGYCMMRFEPHNESCALAAPIFDANGTIRAAVSVSCKRHLAIWNNEVALSEVVREAAREISFKLQYPKVIQTVRRDRAPIVSAAKIEAVEKPSQTVTRPALRRFV